MEYLRATVGAVPWFPLQVVTAVAALALCWGARDRLRLAPLLAVGVLLQAGWLLVRIHAVYVSTEPQLLYASTGRQLLDGTYPHSEYPVGAVLLFALEAALHGNRSHLVHGFLMIPVQLAAVAAVWRLRTRWSAWLAAAVAFWPVNAWFWEWRFDLVPTALLAAGLLFAHRRRWLLAGCVLGLGFTVKWTPALAIPVLAAHLLATRERAAALRLAVGGLATSAVLYVPFLLWSPDAVLDAYRRQGGRSITDESVWHLPLRILGLEGRHGYRHPQFISVDPPGWADTLAVAVQVALLVTLIALAARARTRAGAVALAALAPVAFLATNRVFSVQYFVVFLVAWAVCVALVSRTGRETLVAAGAMGAATVANALIVPVPIPRPYVWELMSLIRFSLAFALSGWLAVRAVRLPAEDRASG
jgi:hypothetical protein